MIGKKLPVFKSGKILTREMLQALTDFAVSSGELLYQEYSDGILCGCNITTTQNTITVNPGILIMKQAAYYITQPVSLPYSQTNEWMVFKIGLGEEAITENFITNELQVKLEPVDMLRENEIELCRFKLQSGAKLRTEYRDFSDLQTEYDTVQLIYAKWAAYKVSSVSPEILRIFLKQAVKEELMDAFYVQFCMEISALKQETLNNQAISLFLCQTLKQPYAELSNEEIYKGLKSALSQMKGNGISTRRRAASERKMIID